MASYTHSCIIRMKTKRAAKQFISRKHRICGATVRVQPFRGFGNHAAMLSKGIYKMQVLGIEDSGDDVKIQVDVQDVFHKFGCTDIEIRRSGTGPLLSVAVRFRTKKGREEAMEEVRKLDCGWRISVQRGKREIEEDKKRTKV